MVLFYFLASPVYVFVSFSSPITVTLFLLIEKHVALREITSPPICLKGYDMFSVHWFVSLDICDPEIGTPRSCLQTAYTVRLFAVRYRVSCKLLCFDLNACPGILK